MKTRAFVRHLIYGTVYAVERGDAGEVMAAAVVTDATACRHRLHEVELNLDDGEKVRDHVGDFEPFEPACSDARHLLADIGIATRAADRAEVEYEQAARAAKAAKETADKARAHVLQLTRDATNPRPLPLFDQQPNA
jgi:hypothetical protein